jgi:hypothetical protein
MLACPSRPQLHPWTRALIWDWMGSEYDVGGRRWDFHLFLDHDGHYERVIRREPDYERRDAGRWSYNEAENLLLLEYDAADELEKTSDGWRVLAVTNCEDSNVLLVKGSPCSSVTRLRLAASRGLQ